MNLITTKDGIQKWLPEEEGWKITGDEHIGGTLSFHFGPQAHHEMKVQKLVPNEEVQWKCTIGHPEWIGTTVEFRIEDSGAKMDTSF
jgi:uncharacterized protein YndB with AHSA1/START domain